MDKYVYVPVKQEYECAYCTYSCDFTGVAYCKWGQVEIWTCPTHGRFEVMDAPLKVRGDQIR